MFISVWNDFTSTSPIQQIIWQNGWVRKGLAPATKAPRAEQKVPTWSNNSNLLTSSRRELHHNKSFEQ